MTKADILALESCGGMPTDAIGGKAYNLNRLLKAGFNVPRGICIPTDYYEEFVETTGAKAFIAYELGGKPLDHMRWEEMWDASLRIRNYFSRAQIPKNSRDKIILLLKKNLSTDKYAGRSSSNFEDSSINSYAGLHESFLNVSGEEMVIKYVKLVWASLWSDSAIAYSRELSLDTTGSRMAVVIQEMTEGEASGVAFARSPMDDKIAVIESVPGLNESLVDGKLEPERWNIDRNTGKIVSHVPSPEIPEGITEDLVEKVYALLRNAERTFKYIPDMEWTCKKALFISCK